MKIEIYEYDLDIKQTICHYRTKLGKWKSKPINDDQPKLALTTLTQVLTTDVSYHRTLAFSTFEEALIAKIFLINKLRNGYLHTIEDIKQKMEKNCPDVSDELNELKKKHAELFV
jgi:hypothetical protein